MKTSSLCSFFVIVVKEYIYKYIFSFMRGGPPEGCERLITWEAPSTTQLTNATAPLNFLYPRDSFHTSFIFLQTLLCT